MSPSDSASGNPSKECSDLSALFTRRYTYGGRDVLRPMWFYISLNKNGYIATRRLILSHGGKVRAEPGDRNTSKEICLVDPHSKAPKNGRPAYSVEYIQRCINEKRLLNVEDFRIPSVGPPRRTPPKKVPIHLNGEHQPQKRQTTNLVVEKTTQGKDSEVTDDLPCIVQNEDQANVHNSNREGGKPGSVIDMTSPPQENSDRKLTEEGKGEKRNEEQDHARAKTQSERAKLVAPKKRRGEWHVAEAKQAHGMKTDSSPQPVSPFLDSMDWTKSEDNDITDLCIEAKEMYQKMEVDPNEVFTLACWTKFGKQDLLPKGRTAKACFMRAKELWQNGGSTNLEPTEKPSAEGSKTKRARLSLPETNGLDAQEDRIEPEHQPNNQQLPEAFPQSQEQENEPQEEPQPEEFKNANRRETREYIVDLVTRIARRGKVTKRRAFRALRKERGHWKRALQHLIGRKEANDA